jgi:hypothetical protein
METEASGRKRPIPAGEDCNTGQKSLQSRRKKSRFGSETSTAAAAESSSKAAALTVVDKEALAAKLRADIAAKV